MRDLALLISLCGLAALALWRPWLGMLALAFFGYMQPHTYAGDFSRDLPVYRMLFAATVVGAIFTKDRQLPPRDWRVLVLLALWLYFFITTELGLLYFLAWPQFLQVSMVLASTFLMLVLINTKEKLFFLIAATALSFTLVAFKGGYWAVIHGFSDRVYGPPNSQYGDNNHFAVAAVMTLPLLVLWFRQSSSGWLRGALALAMALSALAALSSWSRGALLALGVTSLLLLAGSQKRALAVVPVLGLVLVGLAFLPEEWFARMGTIADYQADESSQERLSMWRMGLGYALHHPWAGAGFNNWLPVTGIRDWHSAYIEMMAEHGLVAFLLWGSLLLGTLIGLSRLVWRHRNRAESGWIVEYGQALRASLVAYCVGAAFLGIAYWDLLYHLIALAILLRGLASETGRVQVSGNFTHDLIRSAVWFPARRKTA